MINVQDWEKRKERYEQYWNRTNKTPLLYITSMKDGAVIDNSIYEADQETFWFDPKYLVKTLRHSLNNTYFAADAYPCVSPSLGTHLLATMIGVEAKYNETSSWVVHKDCPLSEITDFSITPNNFYYEKIKEILNYLAEDAKNGDYIVGMVDLNAGMDGIISLIGSENLCFEMIDEPEEVKRVNQEIFNLYTKVFTELFAITNKYQKGTCNWLPVFSEKEWYYITSDFICMVSDEHYEEFMKWEVEKRVNFHERCLFHLDGESAIRHLDNVLKIPNLDGVQVQATPYVHSGRFWIEHIQKIQAAGKCVCVDAKDEDDLMALVENCRPEGLFIRTWFETEEKANHAVKRVEEYYKNKI